MWLYFLMISLSLALFSCKTTDNEFKDAFNRLDKMFEVDGDLPMKSHRISFDSERITLSVPSTERPKITINSDGYSFKSKLNDRAEMSCTFFDSRLDPANAIQRMLNSLIEPADIETYMLYKSQASSVNNLPILNSEYVYNFIQDEVRYSGLYHIGVIDFFEKSVICLMDSPGYIQAFRNSVKEIARTADIKNLRKPDRTQIYAARITEIGRSFDIGYNVTQVYNKDDGKKVIINQSSLLSFQDINKSLAFDYFDISLIGPNGVRHKSKTTMVKNQVKTHDYSVEKEAEPKTYKVSGVVHSQKIDRKVKCKYKNIEIDYQVNQFSLVKDGESLEFSIFNPSEDIDGCTDMKLTREGLVFDIMMNNRPYSKLIHDSQGRRIEETYRSSKGLRIFRLDGNEDAKLGVN